MQPRYNGSILFNLFSQDKKDLLVRIMQKIGIVSFTTAFIATLLDVLWTNNRLIFACYAAGYLLGIIMFALVGIRLVGQQKGKQTFLTQLMFVLGRVFLYIFLPALFLTAVLIIWAYMTHRW